MVDPGGLCARWCAILIGLAIARFGHVPGMIEAERILSTTLAFVLAWWILNINAFIAGLGHDLLRMQRSA